jgi:hypothetical protein
MAYLDVAEKAELTEASRGRASGCLVGKEDGKAVAGRNRWAEEVGRLSVITHIRVCTEYCSSSIGFLLSIAWE